LIQNSSPNLFGDPQPLLIKNLHQAPKAYVERLVQLIPNLFNNLAITLKSWDGLAELKKSLTQSKAQILEVKYPKYESERRNFIRDEFQYHSKKIQPAAINLFLLNFPQNLDLAVALITQICAQSEAQVLDLVEIQDFVKLLHNDELFDLSDAVTSSNYSKIVSEILRQRDHIEIAQFLGLLRAKIENLIKAEAVIKSEITLEESKLNRWYYNQKLKREVLEKWSGVRFKNALQNLYDVYQAVQVERGDAGFLLEKFAVDL
jgi:DNA polymerase III delta subunit